MLLIPFQSSVQARVPRFRFPVVGLIIGLLVTLLGFTLVREQQRRVDQELFDEKAAKLVSGMRQSMTAAEVLLSSAADLIGAQPNIDAERWSRFIDAPEQRRRFPGFQGIAYLRYVDATGIAAATDGARILQPELVDTTGLFHRFDLAGSDAVRMAAMERARDYDTLARTTLLRFPATDAHSVRSGFLLYAPVYSTNDGPQSVVQRRGVLTGFVVMPFAADVLFPGLMQDRYREAARLFRIEIFDGRVSDANKLYFDSAKYEDQKLQPHPEFTTTIVAERFGTELAFKFSSLPSYEAAYVSHLHEAVVVSGFALSFLLFVILELLEERAATAAAARKDSAALRLEVVHRVKNVLAVVQSLANRSVGDEGNALDRQEQFSSRLSALARAHALIVENDWLGTAVGELIRSELAPIAHCAKLAGPHIVLSPQVTQSLALLIHEMAMGAMRRDVRSISVTWLAVLQDSLPHVSISWIEEGGKDANDAQFAHQIAAHGFATTSSVSRIGTAHQHIFSVPLD